MTTTDRPPPVIGQPRGPLRDVWHRRGAVAGPVDTRVFPAEDGAAGFPPLRIGWGAWRGE